MTYTQKDVFTAADQDRAAVMNQALHEFPPHSDTGRQRWSEAFDAHPEWIEALGLANYAKPEAGAKLLYNRLSRKGLIEHIPRNGARTTRLPVKLPANSINDQRAAIVKEAMQRYPGALSKSIAWATALKENPDWIAGLGITNHTRPEQGAYLVTRKLLNSELVEWDDAETSTTTNFTKGNGERLHWTQRPGGREKMRQAQLGRKKRRGPYKKTQPQPQAEPAPQAAPASESPFCPCCGLPRNPRAMLVGLNLGALLTGLNGLINSDNIKL